MKAKINTVSCDHCVKTITQAVTKEDKNANIEIDLKTKIAKIESNLTTPQLLSILDDVGYDDIEVLEN